MFTAIWDSPRAYPRTLMKRGTTVTSVNYCNMLRNELRLAIFTKRRGRLSQDVLLLHNNACLHTAHLTINTIQKLNCEVLKHPAHSPDLAPSNFHLFELLKNTLRGRRFADDDEAKRAVHEWLCNRPKNFFPSGIKKLADCSAKWKEKKRNYFEK